MATPVYLADVRGNLAQLDVDSGAFQIIGNTGPLRFTDISFAPNGAMYGLTANALYEIDPSTAQATLINNTDFLGWNSLTIDSNGVGYATGTLPFLYQVNLSAGLFTPVSRAISIFGAAVGDVTFHEGDLLVANNFGQNGFAQIFDVASSNGALEGSLPTELSGIFGLISAGEDRLYAFSSNNVFRIDDSTGQASFLFSYGLSSSFGPGLGAAFLNNALPTLAPDFNALEYIASYPDLIAAFGPQPNVGTQHYLMQGFREGRESTFDGLGYIASYSDLVTAFGLNRDAGAAHYITNGVREGRTVSFDGLQYIASNADLIGAFGPNGDAGVAHFVSNGFREGRSPDTFNAAQYLANYADLRSAFGSDQAAATAHYITTGFREGRVDEPLSRATFAELAEDMTAEATGATAQAAIASLDLSMF